MVGIGLASDQRMVIVNGVRDAGRGGRANRNMLFAFGHINGTHDLQVGPIPVLCGNPGFLQKVHERRRAAIQGRKFRCIHFDTKIVDPKARGCSQKVLYGLDLHAIHSNRRRQQGRTHVGDGSRNPRLGAEVRSNEDDSGIGRSWCEGQRHLAPGVKAHPRTRYRLSNRLLLAH